MANMMYDIMKELPPRGSVREALMISIRLRRDVQDLYRTFTVTQAIRDKGETGEPTIEAFNKFRESIMPFTSGTTRQADQEVVKRLEEEVSRGPLQVRKVMETPKIKSRLQRIARKTANMGPLGK